MRINDTELDYDDVDEVVLNYWLFSETKEQWAKRVWDCCKRKSEGENEPRVYQTKPEQTWKERAMELWENKKSRRKERFGELFSIDPSSRESILAAKNDSKYLARQK